MYSVRGHNRVWAKYKTDRDSGFIVDGLTLVILLDVIDEWAYYAPFLGYGYADFRYVRRLKFKTFFNRFKVHKVPPPVMSYFHHKLDNVKNTAEFFDKYSIDWDHAVLEVTCWEMAVTGFLNKILTKGLRI